MFTLQGLKVFELHKTEWQWPKNKPTSKKKSKNTHESKLPKPNQQQEPKNSRGPKNKNRMQPSTFEHVVT